MPRFLLLSLLSCVPIFAAIVPHDISRVATGPIHVSVEGAELRLDWPDEAGIRWQAIFSLDSEKAPIRSLGPRGSPIVENAQPVYSSHTGIRRGGWDAFFDYPPSHPEGARSFQGRLDLSKVVARREGSRVVVELEGFSMGPFRGSIAYTFFSGSRLIKQEAVAAPSADNLAYLYDAGFEYAAPGDSRPGNNMETVTGWYDTSGEFQTSTNAGLGPERIPFQVRYRTVAAKTQSGSLAVFPPPHQYFPPRDFTSNVANLWTRAWRGVVGLGIRQPPDTNWRFYPWMNAPPGKQQHMAMFLLFSQKDLKDVLYDVRSYTRSDKFANLPGYQKLAAHWHLAYTVQAMEKGANWTPPFKKVLKDMGVDAAMIMDFHGDGHPRDLTDLRLQELKAFYDFCRAQSGEDFLLMPAEEANVHFGGHWSVAFPKPVLWWMDRKEGQAFLTNHPEFGPVYAAGNAQELLDLIRRENGFMYQTHPRTKGSTGYPDKILETEHFRDPRYWGAGFKAMPADTSDPVLGRRSFRLLDDLWSWGYRKLLLGEVDVFQVDRTHELYAHMNVNYVRLSSLPSFSSSGLMLEAISRGDFFVTTGEILLPEVKWKETPKGFNLNVTAEWTFPLDFAEITWGDEKGKVEQHRFSTNMPPHLQKGELNYSIPAPGWKWARVSLWDVAGNGAFWNPHLR